METCKNQNKIKHGQNELCCDNLNCKNNKYVQNNLLEKRPDLAEEWNYEKNKPLIPSLIAYKSDKYVWWKCKVGHEWIAQCKYRSGKINSICPFCSGEKVCFENCLLTKDPKVAKEWLFSKNGEMTPDKILYNSNKKYWWVCDNGHEWKVPVRNRTIYKTGCAKCAQAINGELRTRNNRISDKFPELVCEWDYDKNKQNIKMISAGSAVRAWWKCKNGHSWEAQVCNRTINNTGCPYCSKRMVSDTNRLTKLYPELLKEWDYDKNTIDPETLSVGMDKKIWWKCAYGHSWEAIVNSRTLNKTSCPYCCNLKINNTNCLSALRPDLLEEWDYDKNINVFPNQIGLGSEKPVWWKCKNNHSYQYPPSYKKYNDGECPYCNSQKICFETSLLCVDPVVAKFWHPTKNINITASDVFPNSNKNAWWKCKNGHEWESTINNMHSKRRKCPLCNKINLNDGTAWDSCIEAYVYLKMKKAGFTIVPHKKYGMGKSKCDFYILEFDLYCEITSFSQDTKICDYFWDEYMRKIKRKENHTVNVLKSNFKFFKLEKINFCQMEQVLREQML